MCFCCSVLLAKKTTHFILHLFGMSWPGSNLCHLCHDQCGPHWTTGKCFQRYLDEDCYRKSQEEWFWWYFGVQPQDYTKKIWILLFFVEGARRIESKSNGDFSTSHPKTSPKLLSGSGRMWWKLGGSPLWADWVTNAEIVCAVVNLFFSGQWMINQYLDRHI